MIEFIKGIFTDKDGSPSSKRIVMFILTLLFVAVTLINILSKKDLEATLKTQLFWLLTYMFSLVFGENITNVLKSAKEKNPPPDPNSNP